MDNIRLSREEVKCQSLTLPSAQHGDKLARGQPLSLPVTENSTNAVAWTPAENARQTAT